MYMYLYHVITILYHNTYMYMYMYVLCSYPVRMHRSKVIGVVVVDVDTKIA